MDEATRKKISEHTSMWDKLRESLVPGDMAARTQRLKEIADSNERNEAMQEAIRRKRMNAGQ